MYNKKWLKLAKQWADDDAQLPVAQQHAQPGPSCPSASQIDAISALCAGLFEVPQPAPVSHVLSESHGLPGDSTTLFSCEPETAADKAVFDLLEYFEERDDFPETSNIVPDKSVVFEFDPQPRDIELLRRRAEAEGDKWREAHEIEKKKAHFERTPMQVLLDRERNRRGCARGACCVYSMWYDPEFGGHGNCTHQCTVSHGALARCGPSLLALDLPPLDYPGDFRGNTDRVVRRAQASCIGIRKRNRRVLSKVRKNGDQKEAAPLSSDATCNNNSDPVVASINKRRAVRNKPGRARKYVPPVQRIRKCMGKRTFGKVQKRPKVFHELSVFMAPVS